MSWFNKSNERPNTQQLGAEKEQFAKQFLIEQGLVFVEQNFSCKLGEIDLIFSDPMTNTLVFVEVRYRKNANFGGAAASITPKKQQKVRNTALFYLQKRKIQPNFRFDVVAIEGNQTNWIASAF